MHFLLYFLFLFGSWGYYFLVYLHFDCSWLFPTYKHHEYVMKFPDIHNKYDYIIVGAGTAGSVIAHRLSQNTSQNILLIEAGPLGSPLLDIPGALALLQLTPVDWNYKTTPQTDAMLSMTERQSNWPRGKMVGGSGRLNNMLFTRGHPHDYRNWFPKESKLQDLNELEDFLRYYWRRSENQQGRFQNDTKWHGVNGPLIASDLFYTTRLGPHFEQAAAELNVKKRDVNTFYTGFDYPQVNIKNGARYSTGHFLVDKLQEKLNLHLVTLTEVWKVKFLDNFEASSVIAISSKSGQKREIYARHGIILCAGVINTPKILQLSGVGNPDHLQSLGIYSIVNSPQVGMNLQDHVAAGMDLVLLDSHLELNAYSLINPLTLFNYIFHGQGPLTTVDCEGIVIGHLDCLVDELRKEKDFESCDEERRYQPPDFQLLMAPLGVTTDYGAHLYNLLNVSPEVYNEHYRQIHGTPTIMFVSIPLHPRSSGSVLINSTNPSAPPLVNPNYLQHPDDIKKMLQGIRFSQQVVRTKSFQKLGARIDQRPFPACRQHEFDSDAYWMCYIRHTTFTTYHPVGTAALGTVLDHNFRVKGTNKLFVADASALPNLSSGNPNAVVVALAEIASDHIKHELAISNGFSCINGVFIPKMSSFYI